MRHIAMSEVDAGLLSDIAGHEDQFVAYEATYETATCSNQGYHVVFSESLGRGGIIFVGSGSGTPASWTGATSVEDVIRRHFADEMVS